MTGRLSLSYSYRSLDRTHELDAVAATSASSCDLIARKRKQSSQGSDYLLPNLPSSAFLCHFLLCPAFFCLPLCSSVSPCVLLPPSASLCVLSLAPPVARKRSLRIIQHKVTINVRLLEARSSALPSERN